MALKGAASVIVMVGSARAGEAAISDPEQARNARAIQARRRGEARSEARATTGEREATLMERKSSTGPQSSSDAAYAYSW